MSEKLAAFQAVTATLSKDTPEDQAKALLRQAIPLLVDLTPTETEEVFADLENRLPNLKKWVRALRDEVKAARKQARTSGRSDNGEHTFTAMLPGLVDLVEHEGAPALLMKKTDGELLVCTTWEENGEKYAPPPKDKIPWLLPKAGEVLRHYKRAEAPSALYDALVDYHAGISELPHESYYDLCAAWDFHTYHLEPFHYSPEMCLYAVPERGKSRTGKGLVYVARRGVHVESLRDAYLVRLAQHYQATIFFDTMNFWQKVEKAGCEDIILGRFERGITVPRVLYPGRGAHRDTVFYNVFGPTIIATNVQIHNILDTRAVQINMPQTSRRFEKDVTAEAALPLKERLTAWRAHHMGTPLPEMLKPASGRLGDILKPIMQIIRLVRPDRELAFLGLVREFERQRGIDKLDSLEAQVLLIINSLRGEVTNGILPVKRITKAFNENRHEKSHFTYQRMGRMLWGLGFDKGRTADGGSALVWDEEKFMKIFSSYGLGKTSERPETSETPEGAPFEAPGVSDQSDVSDDYSGACGRKESHDFLKNARPAPLGIVLYLWDAGRQHRAASWMKENLAERNSLRGGEL